MLSEFDVNETGVTAQGYKALHPKMKKAMRVGTLIYLAIFCAIIISISFAEEYLGGYYIPLLIIFSIVAAFLVVQLTVVPIIFYARYRYNISEDRIDILRGVFIIRHVVVPIDRIHQVEVTRGPINKMFGLADVTVTTAGGVSSIEYLEINEAEGIADKLNERVVKILKERE